MPVVLACLLGALLTYACAQLWAIGEWQAIAKSEAGLPPLPPGFTTLAHYGPPGQATTDLAHLDSDSAGFADALSTNPSVTIRRVVVTWITNSVTVEVTTNGTFYSTNGLQFADRYLSRCVQAFVVDVAQTNFGLQASRDLTNWFTVRAANDAAYSPNIVLINPTGQVFWKAVLP